MSISQRDWKKKKKTGVWMLFNNLIKERKRREKKWNEIYQKQQSTNRM